MTEMITAAPRTLSDVHREYLNGNAISDEVIEAQGIFSDGASIMFPWREDGKLTLQSRPWPGNPGEYYWVKDDPLHLNLARESEGPEEAVLLCEGTKQHLAVASWAPPQYAVYGMPGCRGWMTSAGRDLSRFAGRKVLIFLDADAAENLDVWEGGEGLAVELGMEDAAGAAFVPSLSWGKDGIDDYLKKIAAGRRTERITKLIALAQDKPADRRPTRRKVKEQLPDTSQRPMVVVNQDRLAVIREILGCMQQRWNGTALFCYGGVLTRLRESTTEPLDRDSLVRWMAEAVATFRYKPPGANTPGTYEAAWPEPQTIGAILASGDEFAPLAGISRTPFARPDGTICFKNGWDWDPDTGTGSQVMLVTGNSGMDRLDIPGEPGQEQAAGAARKILGDWLGDDPVTGKRGMPWRDEASRANALALVLTPFLRGIVPLVPLAVISGLQMGVGKNLLADCISLMTTGENSQPLPWIADDDDEIRKQILSSFRAGSSLVCFDEAHVIGGPALTRAITATTYADRILGVSKMASYPNRVTWMALGNQVSVLADMARRAYFIELYPDGPDPENRPGSVFRHEDPRGWTLENRPELVTAALTMIRAWYVAGCPAYPRGSLMGSFEAWDKIMSGILGYAGVGGFLSNLRARRADRDTLGGFWTDHLAWLREKFGNGEFTALDVKTRAMASGGDWDAPPRLDEAGDRGFTRNLGLAYAHNQDRWFGPLRLIKSGMARGTRGLWRVQSRDEDVAASVPPGNPATGAGVPGETDTPPDLGGMKGMKDNASGIQENPAFPATGGSDEVDEADEVTTPDTYAHAGAHAHAHTRTREGGSLSSPSSPSSTAALSFGFDLETADAKKLFTYRNHDDRGFIRLAGVIGSAPVITSASGLLPLLDSASEVSGHNILGFDGLALAWHHRRDDPGWWESFAAKALDTELVARQVWPPRSKETHSEDKLGLDNVAALLGLPGKTDDLKRLKAKHGGYDKIPLDDPEYRSYLEGDLLATAAVSARLREHYDADPYLPREHQVAAINGRMSLNGFRVDQDLLAKRLEEGAARKTAALQALHCEWKLPLGKMKSRGRGKAKHEEWEEAKSPLSTDYGRAWLAEQWERYQVPDPPRTKKTGLLSVKATELEKIAARPESPGHLRSMLEMMAVVTTTRTIYQTTQSCLCEDGRVHPFVSMRQASGRSSVTEPGLTVFGKHGGRHVERDILIPDEGFVLMSFDLSQVDMRAIAGHCQDPAYMALFEPGRDAHAEIAVRVFGDPHGGHCPKGCQMRQDAKSRGHGWNYGMGPERMIQDGVPEAVAYGFDNGMKQEFPVLCSWRDGVREHAKNGGILDNGFGRRMLADPLSAHTVAPALMGQGTAADILKTWILSCPRELDQYRMVTVHDEQVFQFPEADWQDMSRAVMQAAEGDFMGVPILCDQSGPGKSWGEISAK